MDPLPYRSIKTAVAAGFFTVAALVAQASSAMPPAFVLKWGTTGSGPGQFRDPLGVAVGPSGCVYVLDHANDRIEKFNSQGVFSLAWGSHGSGPGFFGFIYGVAADPIGGFVYVVDKNPFANTYVQKFDSNGNFVSAWGTYGPNTGEFAYPNTIAVDPTGHFVYVADDGNHRIQKFDSDGNFVRAWGQLGPGDGDLQSTFGIAVAPNGDVYVSDQNLGIQKFDDQGRFLHRWCLPGPSDGQCMAPYGVALDPLGNAYVVDSNSHRVQKFDSSDGFLLKWGTDGVGDGQFHYPAGIAVDPSGAFIYVADHANNRIEKFEQGTVASVPLSWTLLKGMYR